ncbi:MAG: hypothetical protein R2855_16445 [Thermomicrobiales bacterium]
MVIDAPSAWTVRTVQLLTALPSTEYGARTAGTGVTHTTTWVAPVSARFSQKEMHEQLPRLDLGVVFDAVDGDINRNDALRYRR